ncbi:hypothetical protein L596_001346 [Steinernema carpocapsae]|uniref:Uncharacterized protein n=1 Tax=Steinernema carpocapsae TaxID=34508 RepID=A0A4U8UKZ4_STECR|nr:hypothetical protein L596_001346 [Steinernema carpocapsae]
MARAQCTDGRFTEQPIHGEETICGVERPLHSCKTQMDSDGNTSFQQHLLQVPSAVLRHLNNIAFELMRKSVGRC